VPAVRLGLGQVPRCLFDPAPQRLLRVLGVLPQPAQVGGAAARAVGFVVDDDYQPWRETFRSESP
jgi:hypothetical protein